MTQWSMSAIRRTFLEDGYVVIRQGLDLRGVTAVCDTLVASFRHARQEEPSLSLDQLVTKREAESHDEVYRAGTSMGSGAATYRMLGGTPALELVAEGLGVNFSELHLTPAYALIQLPADNSFDYGWHQDGAFYSQFHDVATLWFPLNRGVSEETGTIAVLPGSHKMGPRDGKVWFRNNKFRQIDTVVDEAELHRALPLEIEVGDLCVLHGNVVHRSLPNHSTTPRISGIIRLVDLGAQPEYRRDLIYCAAK